MRMTRNANPALLYGNRTQATHIIQKGRRLYLLSYGRKWSLKYHLASNSNGECFNIRELWQLTACGMFKPQPDLRELLAKEGCVA